MANNRAYLNTKSRKMIADYCESINLNYCENPDCKGNLMGLAPAHKENRRFYKTAEELADPKNWIALCGECHRAIESNKEKTEALFKILRGN